MWDTERDMWERGQDVRQCEGYVRERSGCETVRGIREREVRMWDSERDIWERGQDVRQWEEYVRARSRCETLRGICEREVSMRDTEKDMWERGQDVRLWEGSEGYTRETWTSPPHGSFPQSVSKMNVIPCLRCVFITPKISSGLRFKNCSFTVRKNEIL